MTSNIGSHYIAETAARLTLNASHGTSLDEGVKRQVMDALRAHFRPEFLNRIDEIIIFHALSPQQMRTIIDIQLRGLMRRLEDRKIHVELTDRAKDLLIAEGYDPTYGARPLKRVIQRRVLDPLAMRVLQGEFREGSRVRIDARQGELDFSRADDTVHA
jgi:ATP-dependent Clp protease ATP-binding subunit ClpB